MPFGFLPIAPIATRSEIGLRPAARRFTDGVLLVSLSRRQPSARASTPRHRSLRHAHASHALDNGAALDARISRLGAADLKTTSVYAHARPGRAVNAI